MKDIGFWPTDAQSPRLATVYARSANGLLKTPTPNDTLGRRTVEMMIAAHVPDTLPGRPAGEGYGLRKAPP
jgi:hypothetical protein